MAVLDTKSNRATLKMDVSHTDHSHVIGKGGNNIKRVMHETGCHVHFPDSNRGNNVQEKSNQVSIAGQPDGVEAARAKIRELLPLVFMFEIPVTMVPIQLPDVQSPTMQQIQQQFNVNVSFRQRQRGYGTTVIIRGSVYNEKLVKEATLKMMDLMLGKLPSPLPVSMQLEIAPQHHLFIIGRNGMNIKQIMQVTGAVIHFPDPNTVAPQRKGLVFISGTIESVYQARKQLIGCLPLVLMFDVKEELEMDPGRVTQLMEHLDVFISVKPKPKQPSKSVIVKSIERNASRMYLARLLLLGIEKELPRQSTNSNTLLEDGTQHNVLNLQALGYFGQNIQPATLQINTGNQVLLVSGEKSSPTPTTTTHKQLLLVNGQKSPPTSTANHLLMVNGQKSPPTTTHNQLLLINGQKSPPTTTLSPPSPKSSKPPTSTHIIPPPPGIYAAPVMLMSQPQMPAQNVVDLMNQCNINNQRNENNQSSAVYNNNGNSLHNVQELVNKRIHSEANSPSRSPCESPHTFRENPNTVDLAGLSTSSSFGNLVSSHPKVSLTSSGSALDLLGLGLEKPKCPSNTSAHTMDLLGLSKTTDLPLGPGLPFHSNGLSNGVLHGSLNHSSLHGSLNLNSGVLHGSMKGDSLRGSRSGLNTGSLHASLSNGSLHGSLNSGSLHGSLSRSSLIEERRRLEVEHLDLRAPGIERKNSQSNLFSSDSFQTFGDDYEEKKLMANKAMQKKPIGESRIPTAYWSGLMFSKSMPSQAIREFGGIKHKYEPPMATTYENPADEITQIDRDPWKDSVSVFSRPIDPAPGEYPSPRKKWPEYGLSVSNHIDGALVPNKSYWSPKLDLAELFIKLGLGKYTDLFQQQEIDLATFLTLTDRDLRELGISTFGARKKMLLAIADLNKRRMLMPMSLEDTDPFQDTSPQGSHPDLDTLTRW